jgi:hypothetical protein
MSNSDTFIYATTKYRISTVKSTAQLQAGDHFTFILEYEVPLIIGDMVTSMTVNCRTAKNNNSAPLF